jgi:hypothetical protein
VVEETVIPVAPVETLEVVEEQEIRYPAEPTECVPVAPTPVLKSRPRYILRAETRRRKG